LVASKIALLLEPLWGVKLQEKRDLRVIVSGLNHILRKSDVAFFWHYLAVISDTWNSSAQSADRPEAAVSPLDSSRARYPERARRARRRRRPAGRRGGIASTPLRKWIAREPDVTSR